MSRVAWKELFQLICDKRMGVRQDRRVGSGTEKMTSIPMVESVAYFECGEVRRQICRVVTYPARRYCYAVGPSWQDYRDAHTILTRA